MNNKYSVACITLVRDKYTLQFVRRCYGLHGIYGRFDSKIRFKIESDGRFDLRFDSNAKKMIRSSLPRLSVDVSFSFLRMKLPCCLLYRCHSRFVKKLQHSNVMRIMSNDCAVITAYRVITFKIEQTAQVFH